MARIIGIDLGTTNSCVAAVDDRGTPQVLAASDGARTTPSVVAFTGDKIVVGTAALRQAITNAPRTVYGTKRLVGRKVNAPEVGNFARSVPFRIVAAPNGDAWVRIDNERMSPQEISSHILRRLKAIAEEALGEPVTRAVITVPAYFDEAQRQATKAAGAIAGIEVVRILNEPTAAALAYGAHRVRPGRRIIAVFDLGGGTFDISIMSVEDDLFEVLSTNGDTALGGEDWDRRVIDKLLDEFFDQYRVDLTQDPVAVGRIKEAVEAAKKALANQLTTTIDLHYLSQKDGRPIHYQRRLTREELEVITEELIERVRAPCLQALEDAGLAAADIEEVLLVGGMTRAHRVEALAEEIFGRRPSKGANPDEVVALGAAAHAAIISGQLGDTTLLDVAPHTIGIRVGDSGFAAIIDRNAMLPVRERKLFATTRDNQEFVDIEIFQGDDPDVHKNRKLGNVRLEGLPPGKAGTVKIELAITVNVESILDVSARELTTGRKTYVRIHPTAGLTSADVEQIVERQRVSQEMAAEQPADGQKEA